MSWLGWATNVIIAHPYCHGEYNALGSTTYTVFTLAQNSVL